MVVPAEFTSSSEAYNVVVLPAPVGPAQITMPKGEYAMLSHLKQRGLSLAHPAKKSELIRAGISVLAALSDVDFLAALKALPAIKTGRPSKAEAA